MIFYVTIGKTPVKLASHFFFSLSYVTTLRTLGFHLIKTEKFFVANHNYEHEELQGDSFKSNNLTKFV